MITFITSLTMLRLQNTLIPCTISCLLCYCYRGFNSTYFKIAKNITVVLYTQNPFMFIYVFIHIFSFFTTLHFFSTFSFSILEHFLSLFLLVCWDSSYVYVRPVCYVLSVTGEILFFLIQFFLLFLYFLEYIYHNYIKNFTDIYNSESPVWFFPYVFGYCVLFLGTPSTLQLTVRYCVEKLQKFWMRRESLERIHHFICQVGRVRAGHLNPVTD